MVFRKEASSFIKVILIGIAAGSLCASLDLIPGENLWTFSSFSGSLGFWAISAMLILMQSETRILAGINTFLYFAFMNSSFFFVHLILPFEFPRVASLNVAIEQSLVWLIPSFICGIFALFTYQANQDDIWGTLMLSLPCGLLLSESISTFLSALINHKYLFQALVDTAGLILLVRLYRKKKNRIWLAAAVMAMGAVFLLFELFAYHTILYF